MIFAFILTFQQIEIGNDYFDYLGNRIYQSLRSPLASSTNQASWYFIQFPYLNKNNCREKLYKENSIGLDSDSQITSRICLAFLNQDQQNSLQRYYKGKNEKIYINPLNSKQKLRNCASVENFNYKNYIARFHKSFIPPNNLVGKLTKLSEEVYLYQKPENSDGDILNEILEIPELRSITPQSATKLLSRWNAGLVQKNEWPGGNHITDSTSYTKGDLRVNRYFNDKGIDGTGQIITIVDSGLDIHSPFFNDDSGENFEYEKVNLNRRKVVFYTRYGNGEDSHDMHGTHVAGIAAGSPNSTSPQKHSLYRGVAPGAKVSIVDITESETSGTAVLNYPGMLLGEVMGKTDSKIALCGWGNQVNQEQSYYYDMLAEFNPGRLFVFAAGNSGPNYRTVTTPGDGKNVLTVGALESLWTSRYERKREYSLNGIKLSLSQYGSDLFYQEGSCRIDNAPIVKSAAEAGPGKVVVISAPDFCQQLKQVANPPEAAIFVGDNFDSSQCDTTFDFPVFTSNDTTIASFEKAEIKITVPEEGYPIIRAAQYSSRGPNYVGIQKPDVIAPGSSIYSSDSDFVSPSDGTSNAAAYVAGTAALLYEYFEKGFYPTGSEEPSNSFSPTADLVRAIIVSSADPLPIKTETGLEKGLRTPSLLSGHGLVNLANVVSFGPNMKIYKSVRVHNEQHLVMPITVKLDDLASTDLDLRIALAYRDPSSTSSYLALQTNIDMYLELPNGTFVFGNHRPDQTEERFSTVERILIYKEELFDVALNVSSDEIKCALHIVTGSGFSDLPNFNYFSLVISGPIVNSEKTCEESIASYEASSFENLPSELTDPDNFHFFKTTKTTCNFPTYGLLCQHNATEILIQNATTFMIYKNTAKLVYIPIPLNYTRIVFHLSRTPSFSGRLALQFCINNIYEYGTNYPFVVSVNGGSSSIGLSRSMFGANNFIGVRISNLVGESINVSAYITYETAIPDATPTRSAEATIPRDVVLNLSISYGLAGFFLIPIIVFSVLICVITKKINNNNKITNAKRGREKPSNDGNEIKSQLISDPL